MTKTTKTVGKTTTKSTKKGGATMDALKKLQIYYNNSQSYNKEHELTYHFLTNDSLEKLRSKLTPEQVNILTKAFQVIDDYSTVIYRALAKQHKLDKAYGTIDKHISELSNQELEELKKKAVKEAEFRSMRKEG